MGKRTKCFQLAHVFISANIKSKNELDFSTEALISSCTCNCSMNQVKTGNSENGKN